MLTLFLHLIALSFIAGAEVPQPPGGLDYRVDASLTYFSSNANYLTGGGTRQSLLNGGSFTDLSGRVTYTQDLDRTFRAYGGFTYSQAESFDGNVTRKNNGFNEILAGGQMWLPMGSYQLVGAGDFVYPMSKVDRGSDDVLIGEGAMKIRLGGWLIYPMGKFRPFVNLAYEYRDDGRSHAIPYSLGAFYKLNKMFWLQGEYRGFEKLFDNADTENRLSRDQYLQRVNAGSYRFYSINPAMSEVAGSAGVTFRTVTVYGEASYMVNGANVADGMTFMVGLAYVPGGRITYTGDDVDSEEVYNPHRRNRRAAPVEEPTIPADSSGFQDSGDGVLAEPDPRLPPPSPDEPPSQPPAEAPAPVPVDPPGGNVQLEMRKAPPKPKAAPAKPKPRPKSKKDRIDKMLQNTEKTLQNL